MNKIDFKVNVLFLVVTLDSRSYILEMQKKEIRDLADPQNLDVHCTGDSQTQTLVTQIKII